MLGTDRVFIFVSVQYVFPCIGSLTQTTFNFSSLIFRAIFGNISSILFPIQTIRTIFPISLKGLSTFIVFTMSSGFLLGPTLYPIGLAIPQKNSTCASLIRPVRSPIHKNQADKSQYQASQSSSSSKKSSSEQHVSSPQTFVTFHVKASS